MTLKYIWRSFQPRLSFPRPFQQYLAGFRVALSPSNIWASSFSSHFPQSSCDGGIVLLRQSSTCIQPWSLDPRRIPIFHKITAAIRSYHIASIPCKFLRYTANGQFTPHLPMVKNPDKWFRTHKRIRRTHKPPRKHIPPRTGGISTIWVKDNQRRFLSHIFAVDQFSKFLHCYIQR